MYLCTEAKLLVQPVHLLVQPAHGRTQLHQVCRHRLITSCSSVQVPSALLASMPPVFKAAASDNARREMWPATAGQRLGLRQMRLQSHADWPPSAITLHIFGALRCLSRGLHVGLLLSVQPELHLQVRPLPPQHPNGARGRPWLDLVQSNREVESCQGCWLTGRCRSTRILCPGAS